METPFNSTANIGGGNGNGNLRENYGATSSSISSSNSNNEGNTLTPQQLRLQQMISMQRAQQNQLQLQMQMSSMSRNPATGVTAPRRYNNSDEDHHHKSTYPSYLPGPRIHDNEGMEESVLLLEKEISGTNEEEFSGVTTSSLEDDEYTNTQSNDENDQRRIMHQDHTYNTNNNPMHTIDFSSGLGKDDDYNRMIQRNFIPKNYDPGSSTMRNHPGDNQTSPSASTGNTDNPTVLHHSSTIASKTIDDTNTSNNNNTGAESNLPSNPYMMMMTVEEQKDVFNNEHENLRMKNNSPISQELNQHNYPQQDPQKRKPYHAPKILHHHDQCHYNTYAQSNYHYNDTNSRHSNVHDPYAEFEAEYGYDCNNCTSCFSCCDNDVDDFGREQQQQNSSSCDWCDCLWHFASAENLHRSICFGAIDGMLTGSGIVAACFGLGWFTAETSSTAKVALVALSLSACTSDGICMAIGHVWSNYVLSKSSIKERTEQRSNFDTHRSEAKAKLVDMLLMRGMLKIDAMSIADTLEGYPDIFVSAITGDGVTNGMLPQHSDHSSDIDGSLKFAKNYPSYGSHGSAGHGASNYGYSNPEEGYYGHGHYLQHGGIRRRPSYSNSQRSFTNMNQNAGFSSVGAANHHFWSTDEYEQDPDDVELNDAFMEGWYEGIFMMIAFCVFSILPSLIFTYIPSMVKTEHSQYSHQSYNKYHNYHSSYNNKYYNQTTTNNPYGVMVSIFVLSVIMIALGIWKSRFFQSSWVVFGIETVLVLYLSLGSAYGIGYALSPYIS